MTSRSDRQRPSARRPPSPRPPIRLGGSTLGGRGVFATTDLAKDAVVEVAPVLLMHRVDGDHAGALARYVFEWDEDDETAYALALGWGSMFNHSGTPSCRYLRADDDPTIAGLVTDASRWALDSALAPALVFLTNRAVPAGEELTIDYSGVGDDDFVFPD